MKENQIQHYMVNRSYPCWAWPSRIFYPLLWMTMTVSCSTERAIPVVVDFEPVVLEGDYSVPVQVGIDNRTTGADAYRWTINGAGSPLATTSRNPGIIRYDAPGIFSIALEASNQDGELDSKEVSLEIFDAVTTGFEATLEGDGYPPAKVQITNTSEGASFYRWQFEGGEPGYSDARDPGGVIFNTPGEHTIVLTSGNGFEEFTTTKVIAVEPYLEADFDMHVAFADDDHQVPVTMDMGNSSVSATQYKWTFEGGIPIISTERDPTVIFMTPGTHAITLEATNGKQTQTISKTFVALPDTNLRTFKDIQLGINTAHNANGTGALFSTLTRETYTEQQVNDTNGPLIDLVFFGLDQNFGYNKFVAPDEVPEETTFQAIPGAGHTKFINSQESCGCGATMTAAEFDGMLDDGPLKKLIVEETIGGSQHFTGEMVPRIVLFETADGRKGAIKIKGYHPQGTGSHITVDIKVQKEPGR